ncbi:GspE/PulE family protein [Singulisphaera acidiphila]|uniref:Type II secretory pathway, ATPase PulE/Tfp pilus assembly pathway, ATPase PilB n=1 Tax=Singulisphaera acidiphila (strain ATCC BAA-1392 / DSM 18658 / VKM B-2454 / MOB10) TaxID=886293 RepID=L0DPD4_SINAD|nr:ATPase, T2SS/T4P/T4SS family [Singulisphaera acidiphila]AGA30536.1 type II secretory pathway, ATPase PulE/Tfp pilus assembly pathway, ATPase PilB [Singulisphaera acidiphila DSM 18658]
MARRLGQILVDMGYLDEEKLWSLLEEQKRSSNELIGKVAIRLGLVKEEHVLKALGEQLGMKVMKLAETTIPSELTELVNETMATAFKIVPVSQNKKDKSVTVAMAEPQNPSTLDSVRQFLGVEVKGAVASEADVMAAIERLYAGHQESIEDVVKQIESDKGLSQYSNRNQNTIDLEAIEEMAEAAPVRKLLNMVLLLSIKDKASDIHFEPFEEEYKMRYRVDGVLYELVPPPRHLAPAIASRIKVMANLDIAERRLPQDGRIELAIGGNSVDIRVSTLPTLFGESVVLRILDRTVVQLDLNKIGMPADLLAQWRELCHRPNGIVLVTGPTSSGKTTTLYATLNELNEVTEKIITTEEPVEYDIDGLIQVPINSEIGVTFAACLRAILRQDPDKILVGETRDLETAEIAIQASLTGHVVFTTLHTNDAPSAITRLRDMGLPTFLITATIQGVLAQRLVRKICANCRTEFQPSQEVAMELGMTSSEAATKKFFYGKGCDRCNNTGYKGRMGVYELLIMNDVLREMVVSETSLDEFRTACRKFGMRTLRESGLQAIHGGLTSVEEILRETMLDEV